MDHLADEAGSRLPRLGPREDRERPRGWAERLGCYPVEQGDGGWCEHVPAVERGRSGVNDHQHPCGGCRRRREQAGEHAIVGAEKLLISDPGPHEPPRRAHAGIDDDDMERACGKGAAGLADEPGRGADVLRGQVVGDIHERERRVGVEEPALHLGHVAGAGSEIGGERDDAGHESTRVYATTRLHRGARGGHGNTLRHPTEPVGRNQECNGCHAMASPSAQAPRREPMAGSETRRSLGDHVINSSRRTGAAP